MSMLNRQARAPWTLRQALLVILVVSLVQVLINLLGVVEFTNPSGVVLWSLADGFLYIGGIYLFLRVQAKSGWTGLGLHRKNIARSVLVGVLTGALTALVVLGTGWLIVELFGKNPEPQPIEQALKYSVQGWQIWALALAGVILAPVKEEILFRGFLYPALRDRVGIKWGILLTAIFFALAHGDLIRFVPLLIGGIALNMVFERTGSLYTAIVAHAIWNGAMGIIALVWR